MISRWVWYISPSDVNIYGVPVLNFSGWFILCGLATAFLHIGRFYFKTENYDILTGFVYPAKTMILSLFALFSPLSQTLLWAGPIFSKESFSEWGMLFVNIIVTLLLLAIFYKGMRFSLSLRKEYVLVMTYIGFHFINILFSLIGGYYEIIILQIFIAVVQTCMILIPRYFSRGMEVKIVDSIEDTFMG